MPGGEVESPFSAFAAAAFEGRSDFSTRAALAGPAAGDGVATGGALGGATGAAGGGAEGGLMPSGTWTSPFGPSKRPRWMAAIIVRCCCSMRSCTAWSSRPFCSTSAYDVRFVARISPPT